MGRPLEALPAHQRVAYYRGIAAEALQLATTTEDCDQKASFVDCAARWLALAHEVEHLQAHVAEFRDGLVELRRRTH